MQRGDKDLEEAILYFQRIRLKRKEWKNLKYGIWKKELAVGSIILLHNIMRKKDMFRKLWFKVLGPYRIGNEVKDKGIYMLKKLDGSRLAGMFVGDRLKIFHPR